MKKYLQVAVKQMVKANENSYLFQNLIKVDNSDIIYTDNRYLTKLNNIGSLPNGYYNRKGELTDITDDNYFERETFSTYGSYPDIKQKLSCFPEENFFPEKVINKEEIISFLKREISLKRNRVLITNNLIVSYYGDDIVHSEENTSFLIGDFSFDKEIINNIDIRNRKNFCFLDINYLYKIIKSFPSKEDICFAGENIVKYGSFKISSPKVGYSVLMPIFEYMGKLNALLATVPIKHPIE
jgi:hypothetical protein